MKKAFWIIPMVVVTMAVGFWRYYIHPVARQ